MRVIYICGTKLQPSSHRTCLQAQDVSRHTPKNQIYFSRRLGGKELLLLGAIYKETDGARATDPSNS